jgi:hypothetical protein
MSACEFSGIEPEKIFIPRKRTVKPVGGLLGKPWGNGKPCSHSSSKLYRPQNPKCGSFGIRARLSHRWNLTRQPRHPVPSHGTGEFRRLKRHFQPCPITRILSFSESGPERGPSGAPSTAAMVNVTPVHRVIKLRRYRISMASSCAGAAAPPGAPAH